VNVEASEDTGGCVWADAKECSESCLSVTRLLMVISGFEQWPRMATENVGLHGKIVHYLYEAVLGEVDV